MEQSDVVDAIYRLVEADDYVSARVAIAAARLSGESDSIILLFEALCAYEENDDLESLRLLAEFLSSQSYKQKRPYALFTAAICLTNIGLYHEAKAILAMVPSSYPGLDKELESIERTLETQGIAKALFSRISGTRHDA